MTIASFQFEDIGPHWPVEGPLGAGTGFPAFSFKPGTVTAGDAGAELIFLSLNVMTAYVANQGDVFVWGNNMVASRCSELDTTGAYDGGMNVGTLFLGGQTGINTGPNPVWTYSFTPGLYGIWVQRAGASLAWVNSVAQPLIPRTMSTTTVPGRMTFATAATAGYNLITPCAIALEPLTKTFTGDLLAGSAVVNNVSNSRYAQRGMRVTGTGIPAPTTAPTTYITDINGSQMTLSAAATASNATVTITAGIGVTSGTTTSGSPVLTKVVTITGVYPNQTITGTGIPASTSILSISGVPGNYNILLSANATATANNILFTATSAAVPNYAEVILNWPYFQAATV